MDWELRCKILADFYIVCAIIKYTFTVIIKFDLLDAVYAIITKCFI
jgi:hypothetical protein